MPVGAGHVHALGDTGQLGDRHLLEIGEVLEILHCRNLDPLLRSRRLLAMVPPFSSFVVVRCARLKHLKRGNVFSVPYQFKSYQFVAE